MKKYKKCGQNESMNALRLAIIITGSIVAAAGIILIIMRFCKKSHPHKIHECCGIDSDEADSWDIDEDILNELELDDEDAEDENNNSTAKAEEAAPEEKSDNE